LRPPFLSRKDFWIFCAAKFVDGTNPAFWLARKANERAEVSECRVVDASGTLWDKRCRVLPERVPASRSIDRVAEIKQARQNAGSISFDDWGGLIESERRDSVRRIFPDSWKLSHLLDRLWEASIISMDDYFRGGVEISGTSVITETLPRMEDVAFRSLSQGGETGEPAEPLIIIRDHAGDLGLLKHELGNKDRVRVASSAPGQIAFVLAIPVYQGATKPIFLKGHR
jgi:hypothetical protein